MSSMHGNLKDYTYSLNGNNMQQIYFSLSPEIQTRPPIRDGDVYQVYCEFNTDLQVFELMLVK